MSTRGFTLIELMIVVAIIAVLAAIALPAYQNYVARSQVAAALAEIAPGKATFESQYISEGIGSFNASDLGLQQSTTRCQLLLDPSPEGFIECEIRGNPLVRGETIRVTRALDGSWSCTTSLTNPTLVPSGCN